jgi:hypothetical protein
MHQRGEGGKAVNTLLGIFKKRIATMYGNFLKGTSGQLERPEKEPVQWIGLVLVTHSSFRPF